MYPVPAHPSRNAPYQPYVTAQPGMSGLAAGPLTLSTWGGGGPWVGAAAVDPRHGRRLQAIDLAAFFGAIAVLGSLFMPWYQFSYRVGGLSVSVSVTALSSESGTWRWLMLVCSLGIAAELLVTLFIFRARTRIDWPHRSLLIVLSVANLVLVTAAMVTSPFTAAQLGLLNSSLAAGAYLGLVGAIVGVGAASCRLVTGPPALVR